MLVPEGDRVDWEVAGNVHGPLHCDQSAPGRGYEYRELEPIFNRYITRAEVEALDEMVGGETRVRPPSPGFGPAETESETKKVESDGPNLWGRREEEGTG